MENLIFILSQMVSSYTSAKDWSEIMKNYATVVGVLIGGVWTYMIYRRQRNNVPKLTFSVDINFVSKTRDFVITELIAYIHNSGLVKKIINVETFLFELRYLKENSDFSNQKINDNQTFQVMFDNAITLNNQNSAQNLWLPLNWETIEIEPGIKRKVSLIVSIPTSAKIVFLRGSFKFRNKFANDIDSAKLIIEVPDLIPIKSGAMTEDS